tara:strand:+ start:680 stop:904 length:225 start_codon:yes stop_codon:yes gene_type:complete
MMTIENIKEIRKRFNFYDKDKSGYLRNKNLLKFLKSMKVYLTSREITKIVETIIEYNCGEVSFKGFIRIVLEDE